MRKLTFFAASVSSLLSLSAMAKTPAVLFVLDLSSSMAGEPLAQVKATLTKVATTTRPEAGLGLITFMHCDGTNLKLEVPVASGSEHHQSLIAHANSLQTTYGTDVYGALMLAEKESKRIGQDWCLNVMLLSDGQDTCGNGSYKEVAARIVQANPDCNKINVIAVGTLDWQNQVLGEVAEAGKGAFQAVQEMKEAVQVIEQLTESVRRQSKPIEWSAGETTPVKKENKVETGKGDEEKESEIENPEDKPLPSERKKLPKKDEKGLSK